MGRPRSENPKDKQMMVKVTDSEYARLDALSSMSEEQWVELGLDLSLRPKSGTPTALTGNVVRRMISEARQDPHVQAIIQMREDYQAMHAPWPRNDQS